VDLAAVELGAVQLVDDVEDVFVAGELHNTLVPFRLMSVGVGDSPRTSHEILEILPGDAATQVLHNDPVLGPCRRTVLF